MATITIKAIERNTRDSHNIAMLNGIDVQIDGLVITGTEKQIAYAQDIATQAVRLWADAELGKRCENRLWDGAELDAMIAKLNADINAHAARLSGKPARVWIDNKGAGARVFAYVAKAEG